MLTWLLPSDDSELMSTAFSVVASLRSRTFVTVCSITSGSTPELFTQAEICG